MISDAISFLQRWKKNGPWVLTAISTDRQKVRTQVFRSSNLDQMESWLSSHNGELNIYFSVNDTTETHLLGRDGRFSKAQKEDIARAVCLHVDIDPHDGVDLATERDRCLGLLTSRLPKGLPKPSVIIFSGGGYQAFWRLKQPVLIDGSVETAEDFELYNVRLSQIFGGDHCHNIDRIMRLPGTINVPDAKKIAKGRKKESAFLVEFNDLSYGLEDFQKAQAVQTSLGQISRTTMDVKSFGEVRRIMDLSELDQYGVPQRIKVVVAQGRHPDQLKERDNSRSAWLFDCVCGLYRAGVPEDVIYSLITDREWGISESVLESKNPERYALRQMTRAKEQVEDPNLREMNDKHAVIGNIGGKCRVIEEIEDDVLKRSRLTLSSFEDIRNRYDNVKVQIGSDKEGKPITVGLGKYWLSNPKRRQYDYMRFSPQGDREGVYNLWRGFAYEPRPGDCSLYLTHLQENVCSGRRDHYTYLINWMARAIQKPASPGEVAVVVRGKKGTGKGVFARIFGRLFGRHHLHVANPSHLVGNFNAHLRDVLVLFADEAFYAGDKKHESVLKMLVTEDSIPIEAKGVDVETYPNYVHLIMAANDPHVIRATGDERRYFVLNIGETRMQSKPYFAKLYDQMENGGYEALLYHLQSLDIEDFEVREVPQTEALQEQKLLSMSMDEEWWHRKLTAGRILDTHARWSDWVVCDEIVEDFTTYADKWKFSRRGNETALGKFISRVCPHVKKKQKLVTVEREDPRGYAPVSSTKRSYIYEFGSLEECRRSWESVFGPTEWPEPIQEEMSLEEYVPPNNSPF